MMGFKNFRYARIIFGGIETMHMIVKGQMKSSATNPTPVSQYYSMAVCGKVNSLDHAASGHANSLTVTEPPAEQNCARHHAFSASSFSP